MLKFLVDFGPAVAFYIIALAAQVSGYTNIRVAAGLAAIATVFLLVPLWAFSPFLAKLAACMGAIAAAGAFAWHYRSKFPWHVRLERTNRPRSTPEQEAHTGDATSKLQSGEWRISLAQPYLAEQVAKLILRADELIEENVTTNGELEAWRSKYRDWTDDVIAFLSKVKATDAVLFREGLQIPELLQTKYMSAYNSEHNALLNSISKARKDLHWKHATYLG